MVQVGDTVTWVDVDLVKHDATVTKLKRNHQLDLEYVEQEPKTTVIDGAHISVQHPDYGCYWEEKK